MALQRYYFKFFNDEILTIILIKDVSTQLFKVLERLVESQPLASFPLWSSKPAEEREVTTFTPDYSKTESFVSWDQ